MAQQGGYPQQQQQQGHWQNQQGGYQQQQQPGGYQQQQPGGYQQQQPGGYQQQHPGGYQQQQQPGGYRQQQPGGYQQQQPGGNQQHQQGRDGRDDSTTNCQAVAGIVFGSFAICSGACLCGIPAIVLGALVVSDCNKGNKGMACGSLILGLVGFALMITFWVLISLWLAGWWSFALDVARESTSEGDRREHDANWNSWSTSNWKRSRDRESKSLLKVASESANKTASMLENESASKTGVRSVSESANGTASTSENGTASDSESANKTASTSQNGTASESADKMALKAEKANVSTSLNSTKRFAMTKAEHFRFLKWN